LALAVDVVSYGSQANLIMGFVQLVTIIESVAFSTNRSNNSAFLDSSGILTTSMGTCGRRIPSSSTRSSKAPYLILVLTNSSYDPARSNYPVSKGVTETAEQEKKRKLQSQELVTAIWRSFSRDMLYGKLSVT
jgi:hypothetical protein